MSTTTAPSLASSSGSAASSASTPRAGDLTVLRRMFDEGFATGDTAVVDELCSPDLVEHQFGMAGRGAPALDHVREAMAQVHASIPDITFTIEDAVQSGDTLWARVTGRGTATGPFFGPPSGRPVEITVIDVVRVVDGRIVEHWGVPDRFALLAQTGVLDRLT
jgi:predicted ester cyclase